MAETRKQRPKSETIEDGGGFVRPQIRIMANNETVTRGPVMKWFDGKDGAVIIVGETHEEHDIWLVTGDLKASLVGVLTPEKFKAMMKLRKGSALDVACVETNFDYVEQPWKDKVLKGKGVSVTDLKDKLSRPFIYEAPKEG